MTDRSKQTLNIYKGDKLVASGEAGQTSVDVALPGGTTATDGEYQGTFKDMDGNESTKADFPAFEVPADTVAVTGVTMSQKTASMKVGDTKVITGTVVPANATNQAVTYTSSDEKIATVAENGTVTAVTEGSANITATTADGGFTASCAVTVVAPTASAPASATA
ncbi:Ig domain-containing protein [Pediococcus acidilactici]|uniref:Ig-like domain-containing protein n=1 Tax=Pediococcus acidilactici TaxID=1254 RepID=UPI00159C25BF|nr:Ig-like domain-containing protein [Pediococcus acidilactici]NVM33698.1 Ig domain-containing protein [Pediococcus acidilactici]